jgi:hypothetical protein
MRVVAPVAVVAMVTVVTVVVTVAAVRVLVTVAVGRRLARVLLVRGARLLLVRVARLGLNRLGLAVVVMVMVVEVLPRKIQLDAAERSRSGRSSLNWASSSSRLRPDIKIPLPISLTFLASR